MLGKVKTLEFLAESLTSEVPVIREQLEQVATDARRAFSRVEDAATAATTLLVVTTAIAVVALTLGVVTVVVLRRRGTI